MIASSYLTTFLHEVEDLLEKIEATVLALETSPGDAELINQLFRAFHTLKGSAGVAGVPTVAAFTHHVETALDRVRSGGIELTAPLVSAVLASKDHVANLMAAVVGEATCDPAQGDALVAQLAALTAHDEAVASATPAPPVTRAGAQPAAELLVDYLVEFQPDASLTELDFDPDAMLAELREIGACTVLVAPQTTPDTEGAWPAWKFLLCTSRGEDAIKDAFIFIAGMGALQIDRGLSEFMFDEPVDSEPAPSAPPEPTTPAVERATSTPVPGKRAQAGSTVRVSAERLDQLVKLIGEMVITQSRLQQASSLHPSAELAAPVESFERLISELRDGVLGLRMVPIGTMFTRFHRLIRDLSGELDKEVELVTAGDETELDKSVIDQLGDALIHILRNSMDHGLESPDVREATGKARKGTLRLAASHEGTQVVIRITDDGRGIDLAAVRRKAIAQGMIHPDEELTEQETIALVTRPGFSTAAAVTQLSGRGVGMDVVKRTIESLRGSLAITTQLGVGTTIKLTLPLTLAIIDGLLVEISGDRFIVPMAAVTENLELTRAERCANNGRNAVAVRGELVPYIRLREVFAMSDHDGGYERIVVVNVDGQRVGLVVDRVVGLHQTVIQPLGQFCRSVDLFSGTTIMGDGRVAMILDLASTVRRVDRASHERLHTGVLGM